MAWARILICAMFMWSASAGAVVALDAASESSAHCSEMVVHDCVPVTTDDATLAGGCSSLTCSFFVQIPDCCSSMAYTGRVLDLPMKVDLHIEGFSVAPGLRPPIFR